MIGKVAIKKCNRDLCHTSTRKFSSFLNNLFSINTPSDEENFWQENINAGNESLMSLVFLFFARKKDNLIIWAKTKTKSLLRNRNSHLLACYAWTWANWGDKCRTICRNHLCGNERNWNKRIMMTRKKKNFRARWHRQ